MPNATNVTIRKVFKGKSGEGQYGSWTAWDVYFDGSDNKYSYFSGGKKPVPVVGQKIAFMEFEAVTKGQYTNRTIKKMVINETPTETTQDHTKQKNGSSGPISMYISYVKDVQIARIPYIDHVSFSLSDLMAEIATVGIELFERVENREPEDHSTEDAPGPDEYDGPPMDSDDPPF